MSIIKRDFPSLNSLTDLFDNEWTNRKFLNSEWTPAVNVIDNKNNYEVEISVPGLKKEDFNITIDNRLLTVSGQSKNEKEEKEKNYTRKEFSSTSFVKTFTLPENIKEGDVNAKYDDGILKLTLNKKETIPNDKKQIVIE